MGATDGDPDEQDRDTCRDDAAPNGSGDEHRWAILQVTAPAGVAVFRVRLARPSDPTLDRMSTSVRVRWEYEPADAGFPSTETQQKMEAFEEAIDDLLGWQGTCHLMLVTTGLGMKEWLFYTSDLSRFMAQFNQALEDHPVYPLRVLHTPDAAWTQWQDIRKVAEQA